MADADFWADGKWNFFCDLCGRKQKSSRAMKTWQGLYVCAHHKEVRNPQDFLRGVKDNQSVPWTRPEKVPETFVGGFCTIQGRQGIAGVGIAGCMIAGYVTIQPPIVIGDFLLGNDNNPFILDQSSLG